MKSFLSALSALLFCSSFAASQPARLPQTDPLQLTLADFDQNLLLPPDDQTPEQKIVPGLWSRLAKSAGHEEISIIIELYPPTHSRSLPPHSEAWDAEQAYWSARVEQQVAAKAKDLLSGLRGLSHFPILFGTARKADLEKIAALPEVFRIYEDAVVSGHRGQGAALINATTLRTSFGGTGNGVGVAVLDSGISPHSELASRLVAQGDYTGTTGDGTVDDNGHGTAVAGVIAGTSGGMAPQASLWAIKVLKADGQGTASSVLDGLNAVYAARNMFGGLDIVNMSLGGGGPFNSDCDSISSLNTLLNNLYNAGISIFVSSGNEGFINGVSHPACHSKVIAVGAVYDSNVGPRGPFPGANNCVNFSTAADQITCYSNSGNPLDILAPADCAHTPIPGGYTTCFNGTSAAAPYATGVAAQLLSLRPATSPASMRNALAGTGRPLTDVNGITRNRIDAVAAFQALGGGGGTCVRDADTACLLNSRFEVEVDWQNATTSGDGKVMAFGGQRAENSESVFFWFFNASNFEVGLKVLDACGLNNRFWVFISGLTDQGWTVRIRDTRTGATRTYANPVGRLTPTTADTSAIPCS